MERKKEARSDLIEMGAASEATQGAWGNYTDEVLRHEMPGLSRD